MPTTSPVTVTQTSKQGSINLTDLKNSFIAAVVAPLLPIVTESLNAGSFTLNWKSIGIAAALGFVVWISKNFIQPAQTIITGTTEGSAVSITAPAAGTSTTATATTPVTPIKS
jgi:hypothetical protein